MGIDFRDVNLRRHMMEGQFGMEKESLRVTSGGYLSHTKHPFLDNPNIERDFCENQTELITDVCESTQEVWQQLTMLHKTAAKVLFHLETGKELLWPFSNPPYIKGEKDIPIANFKGELKGKELYREYLANKYGKKKMLFSGIHFNFSFSNTLLIKSYERSDVHSFREYKDSLYLELAKKLTKYSWLIVYLTAASPVMDGSFFCDEDRGKDILKNLASVRCSKIGYWNDFIPILNYDSLNNYVGSIENYIKQGQLKEAAELYYPVRLKPKGENSLENLKANGINHIELRMIDLNPLEPVGIKKDDLIFLHLLIIYLISLDDQTFLPFEQVMAIKNEKRAAQYDEKSIRIEMGWNTSFYIRDAALHFLSSMERFFNSVGKGEEVKQVRLQERKIYYPEERYAVKVRNQFKKDYVKKGVELADKYALW